ncbi:hypothetical protein AVEN_35100-1 [Araneus ventricosus]|uniref:Uncharacterized protein n=1 Tax=Araneus ventricosus TaxID=182803 RepID=A0A4Y2I783_ARAVE|nr:hypothetical protein AVEN_35100-1 [Araneus ventricosus]
MRRHCEGTLCGIAKCRFSATTAALNTVREMKPFEVGREGPCSEKMASSLMQLEPHIQQKHSVDSTHPLEAISLNRITNYKRKALRLKAQN